MARAMHCITNHDVWSRAKDLASQSLFPLSSIYASVGMVNEYVLSCVRSLASRRWSGLSFSCGVY